MPTTRPLFRRLALSERGPDRALWQTGFCPPLSSGVPGRFYYRKRRPAAFNVQAVLFGGPLWKDNLRLRDFLSAHPAEARRYAEAKQQAFHAGHRTLLAYSAAKAAIVTELLAAAQKGYTFGVENGRDG